MHNSPSFLPKALAVQNWHRDGSLKNDRFILSNEGKDTEERTLATSSAILTNGSNFFRRALNDVTSFCWFDRESEILVNVSETLETRGCQSFFANVWPCPSLAAAEIGSCVIRTDSLAVLGFPSLLTKDKTTSKLSSFQHCMTNQQLDITCLHSDANIEAQADAPVRYQPCQGTCPSEYYHGLRWW